MANLSVELNHFQRQLFFRTDFNFLVGRFRKMGKKLFSLKQKRESKNYRKSISNGTSLHNKKRGFDCRKTDKLPVFHKSIFYLKYFYIILFCNMSVDVFLKHSNKFTYYLKTLKNRKIKI